MRVYGKCECFDMQMFVFCMNPVAVLNAAFCLTCLLMLVEDARGVWKRHTPELVS